MDYKKFGFIALLIILAIAVIAVAVYLIVPQTDNIPDELESYVSTYTNEAGGLQVEQDASNGKYGEMREPN